MSSGRLPNIHRSKKHEAMVQRLCMEKEGGMTKQLFPTIREFMCFCALLGYALSRRRELDKSYGPHEDIAGAQFDRGDSEDIVFMIALADSRDTDILRLGREADAVAIFEEYAFGGMEIVNDWLLQNGGEAPDSAILAGLKQHGFIQGAPTAMIDFGSFRI